MKNKLIEYVIAENYPLSINTTNAYIDYPAKLITSYHELIGFNILGKVTNAIDEIKVVIHFYNSDINKEVTTVTKTFVNKNGVFSSEDGKIENYELIDKFDLSVQITKNTNIAASMTLKLIIFNYV